jgi:sugar lactone lactonase YvrE
VEDALTMDTKPEHFADGLHFPECPRWHDGALWVSDTWAHTILRFEPVAGRRRAGPDGICLDEAGGAWVAEWIGRRVLRVEAGGAVTDEISFDLHPLAVALGGADRRQLFICLCAQIGKRDRKPEPLGAIAVLPVDIPGAGEP